MPNNITDSEQKAVTAGAFTLAVTGASGMPYARRVLQLLLEQGHTVHCVVSTSGQRVLSIEEGLDLMDGVGDAERLREWSGSSQGELILHHRNDVASPIASGSFPLSGMIVAPCSGSTLAKLANGIGGGLIERAAEVCFKERRRLVLVPRETPLSLIHLRNMLKVAKAGATVLPASPGFYNKPKTIAELVDMVAGRVLTTLGLPTSAVKPWTGPE